MSNLDEQASNLSHLVHIMFTWRYFVVFRSFTKKMRDLSVFDRKEGIGRDNEEEYRFEEASETKGSTIEGLKVSMVGRVILQDHVAGRITSRSYAQLGARPCVCPCECAWPPVRRGMIVCSVCCCDLKAVFQRFLGHLLFFF